MVHAEHAFALLCAHVQCRRSKEVEADNPLAARDARIVRDGVWGDSEILAALIALATTGEHILTPMERRRIGSAVVAARQTVWPAEGF